MTRVLRSDPILITTAVIFILLGLALAGGGIWLLRWGGSAYYLIAGAGLAICGVLVWARRRAALWVYAGLLLGTLLWSVLEVRFDWWQLLPRVDLWFVLGAWLLLPLVNRRLSADVVDDGAVGGRGTGAALLWAAMAITLAVGLFALTRDYHHLRGEVAALNMDADATAWTPVMAANDWVAYGASAYGDRYAPAQQITPANVDKLRLAWTFHTGDFKGPGDPQEIANEVTPLKANGLLYLCTPHNIVIALDPDTGVERWRFDPQINRDASSYQHMICRGVAYYDAASYAPEAPSASAGEAAAAVAVGAATVPDAAAAAATAADCPRRIFAPTADATIVAINADNGRLCESFGTRGVIGLTAGMPMTERGFLNPTSPPVVTRHVLIVAASVTDNDSTDEPSGVIRGYDIDSGRLLWNWDSGNPDATAPLAPGQTYVGNSPNSWSVSSVDEKLGMVYIPMGNQTPDIWGGNRISAGERFNSAIVALDIATGNLRWSYQTVHHDLWDMDIGSQPSLVDLDLAEGRVPALIAPTKRGDLYVLDRRSGRLLVPAPERPVPQGAASGDRTAPTQPFSELTFLPERDLRESDMWGTHPFDQLACRIIFKQHRYEGIFTPPSERGTIVYPGNLGIFDWGGVAIDPVRQLLIASPTYMAFRSKLVPRAQAEVKGGSGSEQGLQPMTGTPFAVDLRPLLSPLGIPCQAPPWGYMAAVDLKTMRKVWMHKNGTVRDSAPLPIPLPLGVPSLGGPMTTAGGVAFLSSTLDYYLRAYDVRTGKQLWQERLPAGGQATPMSYVSDKSGRQYVVVMAGGHGSLGTRMGDALVAYALPDTEPPAQ